VTFVSDRSTVSTVSEQISTLEETEGKRGFVASIRRYFADRFSDVSPSEKWGYAVWAAMGVVIAVPEIWAAVAGSDFLWPTISTTVGHLEDRWPVVALLPVWALIYYNAVQSPPASAINASPGRTCKWYVLARIMSGARSRT